MGQALRRATGKARTTTFESPQPQAQMRAKNVVRIDPQTSGAQNQLEAAATDSEGLSKFKNESSILEERDAGYDAMLSKMVGRITSKPGGKLEMGEAFIVEKYNRPLPKLRTSRDEGSHETLKSNLPGTVDIQQLRQIFLLYEGRSKEHQGAMTVDEIAEKFRIESSQVRKILQFVSLPQEDIDKNTQK